VEYAAAQLPEGAPKPVLGKAQFEVVAEGSKQFDIYLMRTLQGADDEIAFQDQWRDDHFELDAPVAVETRRRRVAVRGGAGTTAAADGRKATAVSRTAAARRNVREEVSSEEESESDSDSEDGSDDSSDGGSSSSDEPVVKEKNGKGKKKDAKASFVKDEELEELEEFRRYQARKKAKSKS
jgi:hypothetical protein